MIWLSAVIVPKLQAIIFMSQLHSLMDLWCVTITLQYLQFKPSAV